MKVEVTHLKAPWPDGTAVGLVVDLPGDEVPGWALGKCKPVAAEKVAADAAVADAVSAAKAPAAAKGKK